MYAATAVAVTGLYFLYTRPVVVRGGGLFEKKILIVDTNNLCAGLLRDEKNLISCMEKHYESFIEHNPEYIIHYVLKNKKNMRRVDGKCVLQTPVLSLERLKEFVSQTNARVSVAVEYISHSMDKWKKYHYLRARDDYSLFLLARMYKKKYMRPIIMTDDKFKDYDQFGFIPNFTLININGKDVSIRPKPNSLGPFKDYEIIKVSLV